MILPHTIQRFSSIPKWPRKRRALRHLALRLPPLGLALTLYFQGVAQRHAAMLGDAAVRAARAAVRTFFHYHDAVSILEHAVTGVGLALVGLLFLRFVASIE